MTYSIPFKEQILTDLRSSSLTIDELNSIIIKLKIFQAEIWNEAIEQAAKVTDIGVNKTDLLHEGTLSEDYSKRIRALKEYQTQFSTNSTKKEE